MSCSHLCEPGRTGTQVVLLGPDGSASVTLTYAFDLNTKEERTAFEMLRTTEARTEVRERFEARMASVAGATAAETSREMAVSAATIDVTADERGGLVRHSVEWSNLAVVEDGRLILTEPFASGFESDQPVTVRVPEDYAIKNATLTPDDRDRTRAVWNAGTTFDEFELIAVKEDGDNAVGGVDADQPGFDAPVGLVTIDTALLMLRQ